MVDVKALTFQYPGTEPILRDISFRLDRGERLLITGENGAGKTSLLKLLLGLLPHQGGDVQAPGLRVGSRACRRERLRAAYPNQGTPAVDFPITAGEVAALGAARGGVSRREAGRRVTEALERTGTARLRRRSFRSLSGGEKQRVSIARCLVQGPEILFLDEPTASLDRDSRGGLLALVESLPVTPVMVSHDPEMAVRPGWRHFLLSQGRFAPLGGAGV